MTNGALQVIMH
jgi:hypothetical protein